MGVAFAAPIKKMEKDEFLLSKLHILAQNMLTTDSSLVQELLCPYCNTTVWSLVTGIMWKMTC